MFEDRGYKRTFYSAPQSVTSLVAAFLEPAISVSVFLAVSARFGEPIVRADLTLCLLVFALTFPGRRRFWGAMATPELQWLAYFGGRPVLRHLAPFIRDCGVQEAHMTLPQGWQPRIVELTKQVQGATASVFIVPKLFGISIIQGRLRDMNGVPLVGLCETPFTGTTPQPRRQVRIEPQRTAAHSFWPVLAPMTADF